MMVSGPGKGWQQTMYETHGVDGGALNAYKLDISENLNGKANCAFSHSLAAKDESESSL